MPLDMDLTVISIEDFGPVRVLRLGANNLPTYEAGHYAVLQFGDHAPRPYSIANPSNGGYLEFHIKNGGHAGGSTHATTTLSFGDTVVLHGFGGNYQYLKDCDYPVILIAGGTGLAPLLAIARASLDNRPERSITLYHGGRHRPDLYLDKLLSDMGSSTPSFTYIPVLSEEMADGIMQGYVGDIALRDVLPLSDQRFYIAGPVDMLRQTVDAALRLGISPDVIHSDLADLDTFK